MNFHKICVADIISQDELKIDFLNQTLSGKYCHKIKQNAFPKWYTNDPTNILTEAYTQ